MGSFVYLEELCVNNKHHNIILTVCVLYFGAGVEDVVQLITAPNVSTSQRDYVRFGLTAGLQCSEHQTFTEQIKI